MARTLVTGATGFIRYEVARLLAGCDATPRPLVRRPLHQGIPAALDECASFRWQHPVLDRRCAA